MRRASPSAPSAELAAALRRTMVADGLLDPADDQRQGRPGSGDEAAVAGGNLVTQRQQVCLA